MSRRPTTRPISTEPRNGVPRVAARPARPMAPKADAVSDTRPSASVTTPAKKKAPVASARKTGTYHINVKPEKLEQMKANGEFFRIKNESDTKAIRKLKGMKKVYNDEVNINDIYLPNYAVVGNVDHLRGYLETKGLSGAAIEKELDDGYNYDDYKESEKEKPDTPKGTQLKEKLKSYKITKKSSIALVDKIDDKTLNLIHSLREFSHIVDKSGNVVERGRVFAKNGKKVATAKKMDFAGVWEARAKAPNADQLLINIDNMTIEGYGCKKNQKDKIKRGVQFDEYHLHISKPKSVKILLEYLKHLGSVITTDSGLVLSDTLIKEEARIVDEVERANEAVLQNKKNKK